MLFQLCDLFLCCIIRALFDRAPNSKEELNFKKGDILYVTDTMFNGHMGCWRACLVNEEDAQKRDIGMVPSRMKYVLIEQSGVYHIIEDPGHF